MNFRNILGSIGNQVFGNSKNEKEHDTNEYFQNNQEFFHKRTIFAKAIGELWHFIPKNEEMKLLSKNVEAIIIDEMSKNFECVIQFLQKDGSVIYSEKISNNLQIQYNREKHNMTFVCHLKQNRIEILSFVFEDPQDEDSFKSQLSIKLCETNYNLPFNKIMKEEDKLWIQQSYETAPENQCENIEDDKFELDDDVKMKNMANLPISFDNKSDNESSNDSNCENEISFQPKKHKENAWEKAIKKKPIKKKPKNLDIKGSRCHNLVYVTREEKPGKSVLNFFKYDNNNELDYKGQFKLTDKVDFTPKKSILHKNESKILFLNEENENKISVMDFHKEKICNEWNLKEKVHDISNITKNESMNGTNVIYGMNNNSMFLMDGRINDKNKIIKEKSHQYKTINNMNCIATSGGGFIASGANDGRIRLYNRIGMKRCNTCLTGFGDKIKYMDISNDGKWILATCKDYLLVIPTEVSSNKELNPTGFEGKGIPVKDRKSPYRLKLKPKDLHQHQIGNVNFTKAKFDSGKTDGGFEENWIISSTGPFIIKWDFRKLKKSGIVNDYSIRQAKTNIIRSDFRFNHNKDLIVSEKDYVYAQHTTKR